jgi:hypothetical protein
MDVSFGRVEVYIGYSAETLQKVTEALAQAGIHAACREVSHAGRGGSMSDLPGGAPMDGVRLYAVSVNQAVSAQARSVVGQVLQHRARGRG